MQRQNSNTKKSQIISEYLSGTASYSELGIKYGIKWRTIQTWVRSFRLSQGASNNIETDASSSDKLSSLKKQLEQSQLKNQLLEEMLRLSEEYTGIDIRKKFGTKQS